MLSRMLWSTSPICVSTLQPVSWLETRADAIIAQGLSPLLLPAPPDTQLDLDIQANRREEASVEAGAPSGRSLACPLLLCAFH